MITSNHLESSSSSSSSSSLEGAHGVVLHNGFSSSSVSSSPSSVSVSVSSSSSSSSSVSVMTKPSISSKTHRSTQCVKRGFAKMFEGGVIMDVVNAEQARIAEQAGACAVMALEKIPADIRSTGGISRMSDPGMIEEIMKVVSIPVMAKCRIGHFVEAQILEEVGVDFIDESEVLTVADDEFHVNKENFRIPFVCGCRNLGEALRRINEGASMIRTKGEAGTGNIVEAVRHIRAVRTDIEYLQSLSQMQISEFAKKIKAPIELVLETRKLGRLPVVNFAAGGVATPADAALCMQLGVDGVFVGSGIFKSENPAKRAKAMVQAVAFYKEASKLLGVSRYLGAAMVGINAESLETRWANRESGNMEKENEVIGK